ncbi:MAG: secretion protein EspK [Mycobacterium sp.]|uniref:Secretion protein EspK n=1 Tax=Mycobacterium gordonae TaxID=1778 RepID=A0A1A6BNB4_MYCGO|nr:secretion protein EspK [Mycobacterium gordonae]MCV7008177.1 secretion protein EspK [Mycobacterium gordonae]OBS03833.1 secretion protein EspK [Mycobacterium gordonae]ORV71416.1 secretion protein EspK [Mycobacterium gordonae]PJE13897.1 MAG: secretion protein EspK [Mycobacterium sp.]
MGIPRPTGEYAGQMLEGGWPEADEDTFYERAQSFNAMLHKVTDVIDAARHQQVEVFHGGIWTGGAAGAANGALGTNLNEMGTLQDYLATVITWHQHIGNLIAEAKSEIGNNVDGTHREISILENDTELEPEERQNAINSLVRAARQANATLIAEAAEQVLESKNWKPPHNALEELLRQVTPPMPEVPTLVVPTPGAPTPGGPAPTPFEPVPAKPYDPLRPGTPVNPVTPRPFEPVPAKPYDPLNPGPPVTPGNPTTPITPIPPLHPSTPVTPGKPSTPGIPVSPVTPVKPKPDEKPAKPATPTPRPAPAPAPSPGTPAPEVTPAPAPAPAPTPGVQPAPDQPSLPTDPGTPSTPSTPGTDTPHVKPAAAVDAPTQPGHAAGSGPSHRGDDSSPAMAPAAATGMPAAAARGSSTGMGMGAASSGAAPTAGAGAAPSAGSRAAGGRAPLGAAGRAPATATTRAASARTAAPARPAPPERKDDTQKDKNPPADDVTSVPSVPVSAARAARDAVAAASARGAKKDPLRLARRVAAALNARDSGGDDDYGFFWVTAVTTDGEIVVANSYGLAYIPEGVELPAKVHLASADRSVPVDEKARSATYPAMAIQTWAAFHDLKLRAVIGTAEQLANTDVGAAKVILEDDDIPDSGKMVGRSRLEVVDPSAAAQLQETDDLHLVDLLPPAPANAKAPDDERHMLWFDLMKPMTSTATGREVAHLRAFHAYAAHSRDLALHQAYAATDAETQRPAVVDFLYWRYVAGLLDSALTETT